MLMQQCKHYFTVVGGPVWYVIPVVPNLKGLTDKSMREEGGKEEKSICSAAQICIHFLDFFFFLIFAFS